MQLNADGTITINFGDQKVRVRPPNVGQYRRIREVLAERDDKRRTELEQWKVGVDYPDPIPLNADGNVDVARLTAEQVAAISTVNRKSQEYNEVTFLEAWHLVLVGESLGDKPFPSLAIDPLPSVDTDTWPIELLSAAAYNLAMTHWAAAPLLSGGSPAATTNEPQLPADL